MASTVIHMAITSRLLRTTAFHDPDRLMLGSVLPDAYLAGRNTGHMKIRVGGGDARTLDLDGFRARFGDLMIKVREVEPTPLHAGPFRCFLPCRRCLAASSCEPLNLGLQVFALRRWLGSSFPNAIKTALGTQGFLLRGKNPSKMTTRGVLRSFRRADLRQDEEKATENTCCIVKAFDEVLAQISRRKPAWVRLPSPYGRSVPGLLPAPGGGRFAPAVHVHGPRL